MTDANATAATADETISPEDVGLVWVDARNAVLARWDGGEPTLEMIQSGVPRRRKAAGSVRRGPARPFGGGRVGGHGTENRRRTNMRRYFSEVAEKLADLDHVEVIGRGLPHQKFAELLSRLAEKHNNGLTVETQALTRRPSERQLAARLRSLVGRPLPRRTSGPYQPLPPPTQASGRIKPPSREDLPKQKPRHLPERKEIDLEVEMMLAGDEPMWD